MYNTNDVTERHNVLSSIVPGAIHRLLCTLYEISGDDSVGDVLLRVLRFFHTVWH